MLNFIINGLIQSQTTFKEHKHHSIGEIRAVNLLLDKTHSLKSSLELTYMIDYLRNKQIHLNEKSIFFTDAAHFAKTKSLSDFLESKELIIVINLFDHYIYLSYFFACYKIKNQFDYSAIAKKMAITNKDAKIIADYYESILTPTTERIISYVSTDISNTKKSEEALLFAKKQAVKADQAKTEFLENMRHDIRTPLTGIIGFSQLIQAEAINPRVKDYADNLVLATTALLDFQNEILEAIKITASPGVLSEETFHLRQLAEKVMNLVRPKAIIKKLALELKVDPHLPEWVYGDAKRLFRIFLELITNALKFTAVGKIQIYLSADKIEHNHFTLLTEISDTGIGISDDKKEDVFIRLHRLSPSSDGVYEGTGLGLAIVKKYVKEMNGKISLKSDLGKGTTFICSLPLEIKEMVLSENYSVNQEESVIPLYHHVRILLVEDHVMTATVTQLMLQEIQCDVEVASDAKMTLEKFDQQSYDFVLMDLGLPDSNGYALAKKIREQNAMIPIVVLTAHHDVENESRCLSSGVNAVFQKPLLKSAAIKLLNRYFSEDKMKAPIIDLKLGANRIHKNESEARVMLDLLLKHIESDEDHIRSALDKQDYNQLHDVNHKLLGGLAYCGAPRLEHACIQLQNALKKGSISLSYDCARAVLAEIQLLKAH